MTKAMVCVTGGLDAEGAAKVDVKPQYTATAIGGRYNVLYWWLDL